MKQASVEERVAAYIKANYDIPKDMVFYLDHEECEFPDWVEEYIEGFNENVDCPFDEESDESDIAAIGDEILLIMTSSHQWGRFTIGIEESD